MSMRDNLAEAVGGHAELQRLIEAGRHPTDETIEAIPEPMCLRCRGAGFLRRDVPATHEDFGRLVECPCGLVLGRRALKLWGRSMIPAEYADLTLDTHPNREIVAQAREWFEHGSDPWLLLDGQYGTGKTGIAVALVKLALDAGTSAVFRVVPDLLSEIRATYSPRQDPDAVVESDLLEALKTVDLLALDDLGAERMTGWVEEKLYEVLNHRHNERKRTIVTTNLEPGDLSEHVGERIFWRVKRMAQRIEVIGPNLRMAAR